MRKATMRVSQLLKQRHGKPLGVRFLLDAEPKELTDYLNSLTNYEKRGVPKGAGTDSDDGFDLGLMRRLMARLGNPQSNFKAVHIAGTKGQARLGSARDATNILCSSELAASVITTIGEEHLAALGGSLETVAVAKSGIIKHGHPHG